VANLKIRQHRQLVPGGTRAKKKTKLEWEKLIKLGATGHSSNWPWRSNRRGQKSRTLSKSDEEGSQETKTSPFREAERAEKGKSKLGHGGHS